MTPELLKERLASVLGSPRQLQIYFVIKQNDVYSLRLADIEDEKTRPEVQRLFEDAVREAIISNEDLTIRNLSSDDEAANALYRYDFDSYPEELSLFRDFNIKEAVDSPKFNFHQDSLSHLFGYIICEGSMENCFVLFKKHYPVSLIKRESFLLGAIKDKERFEVLPGDDIIRLNGCFQLIRVDDAVYVLDLSVLEKSLGFSELIKKAAIKNIEAINSLGIIEDIETLSETVESLSFARKLSRINSTSPIFKLKIPAMTILEFSKTYPGLSGQFKYSEDGNKIRLDTKKSKNLFLKLMNDAFLRSELTKQYYEALAKDMVAEEA